MLKHLTIWCWLGWWWFFLFSLKKNGNANKKIQSIQLSPSSEITEKCYFCMTMVSRKANADRLQPPSAHWYLFCKFRFYSVLAWQSFHQHILLTTKEINYKDIYKWKQKNIFTIIACLLRKAISMLKSNSPSSQQKNVPLPRNATKNLLFYMIIKLILLHLPDGKSKYFKMCSCSTLQHKFELKWHWK